METQKLRLKISLFAIVSILSARASFAVLEAPQERGVNEAIPVLPAVIPQNSLSLPENSFDESSPEAPIFPSEQKITEVLPILEKGPEPALLPARAQKTPRIKHIPQSTSIKTLGKHERKAASPLNQLAGSLKKSNSLGALSHFIDGAQSYPAADIGEGERFAREIVEAPQEIQKRGVAASITVFGSARLLPRQKALAEHRKALALARLNPNDKNVQEALKLARQNLQMSKYYEEAYRFGQIVARESGGKIAVATGGGPGIMEAANRGAFEIGGTSIGHTIRLPHEEASNPYITRGLNFIYDNFAPRKINLRRGAAALAFFPGGFGTMDELFETLTLIQTGKIPRVPIVLVGKKYWNQILNFKSFSKAGVISPKDLSLFKIVDTADEAWTSLTAQENIAR